MELVKAILAIEETLPPITALGYEYVVAANGLFVRAEDSRLEAMLPISHTLGRNLHGLKSQTPRITLKCPRVPVKWLYSIHQSAFRQIDREVLYQFRLTTSDEWTCVVPSQIASATSIRFLDQIESIIDLHSHNTMNAFFSETDNGDEAGLRFYCVIGNLDTDTPKVACRIGVYGNHWRVPVTTIFESTGPFKDTFTDEEI